MIVRLKQLRQQVRDILVSTKKPYLTKERKIFLAFDYTFWIMFFVYLRGLFYFINVGNITFFFSWVIFISFPLYYGLTHMMKWDKEIERHDD